MPALLKHMSVDNLIVALKRTEKLIKRLPAGHKLDGEIERSRWIRYHLGNKLPNLRR